MSKNVTATGIIALLERKADAEQDVYYAVIPIIDLLTRTFKARINVDDVFARDGNVNIEFHVYREKGMWCEEYSFSFPAVVVDSGDRQQIEDLVQKQFAAVWN